MTCSTRLWWALAGYHALGAACGDYRGSGSAPARLHLSADDDLGTAKALCGFRAKAWIEDELLPHHIDDGVACARCLRRAQPHYRPDR